MQQHLFSHMKRTNQEMKINDTKVCLKYFNQEPQGSILCPILYNNGLVMTT